MCESHVGTDALEIAAWISSYRPAEAREIGGCLAFSDSSQGPITDWLTDWRGPLTHLLLLPFYMPADAGVGDVDIDVICKAMGRGLYWN